MLLLRALFRNGGSINVRHPTVLDHSKQLAIICRKNLFEFELVFELVCIY